MALANTSIHRAGHEGFFAIADEAAKLGPAAVVVGTAPTGFALLGYTDVPSINTNDNVGGVEAAAAYRDAAHFKGGRHVDFKGNITLSAVDPATDEFWIRYFLRSSGLGTVKQKGLPIVCIAAGAVNDYDTDAAYTDLGRYSLPNTLSLQYSEGQPIKAAVDFVSICKTAGTALSAADMGSDFGQPLVWQNLTFSIGSTDYTEYLSGATLSINNNVQRRLVRPDISGEGTTPELSRCARALLPGIEKSQLSFQLADKLPSALRNSSDWGTTTLVGTGLDPNGATRTMTVTINHALVQSDTLSGGAPSNPFAFNVPIYSRHVTIGYA